MSIIIQTGHQSSYSDQLMQMLYERGLSEPLKSHTHQMTAREITEKLSKILNKNSSIINARMVDNLIVDLLLANLDQDDWGWADVNNLDTLRYWQQADESSRFVLIFDSPKCLLKQLLGQTVTVDVVESAIQEWIMYHQKLLDFFKSAPDNCLLMEGELAVNNLMNIKEHIQAISTNLKLKNNWQLLNNPVKAETEYSPMFEMVTSEILKQYPECLALYEALIEKSTIRLRAKNLPATNDLSTLIQSLNLFNEQEEFKKKILIENEQLQQQMLVLISEKQALEQQVSQNILLLEQSKNSANAEQKAQIERSEQENKLLIGQLHQVQEELEKYYLQHQKATEQLRLVEQQKQQLQTQADIKVRLESELKALKEAKQKAEQLANEQKKKADEVTQHKQKLESDLATLKNAKQQSDKQVDEQKKQADILMSDKKKLESEFVALKDIKQKSDVLVKEKQKLESELATLKEAKQKAEQQAKASNNAKQENELLISQLHQVQEELERYYLENQKLKSEKTKEPPKPVYYGAADRVKEDLPYRLGATMVSHSKSAKDLAVLPLALAKEYREFNKNKPSDELPAIDEYQDAQEAEKVKKHLSYRLGKTLIEGFKSPKSAIDLPVKLGREIVGFKK